MTLPHRWFALVASVCLLHASHGAAAETPYQYVIVPAIGHTLSIVKARAQVGSSMSNVSRESVAVAESTFDEIVFLVADKILRETQGDKVPEVLHARVSAGTLVGEGSDALDMQAVGRLVEALRSSVADPRRTRIIIVAPLRAPLEFPVAFRGLAGGLRSGPETGMGFYVDALFPIRDEQTGATDRGFLAAFANVELVLLDFETRAVIARQPATRATLATPSRRGESDPWKALSAQEKTKVLALLLRDDLAEALPVVLKAAR